MGQRRPVEPPRVGILCSPLASGVGMALRWIMALVGLSAWGEKPGLAVSGGAAVISLSGWSGRASWKKGHLS